MIVTLRFQPGFNREGTQFTTGPSWYDGDKVRWRKGQLEEIGGWQKLSSSGYLGVCRSLLDWGAADATQYLGVGTSAKFYIEAGGTYYDITPIRSTTAAGDVTFAAVNGSSTITATDTDHGAAPGDYVTFAAAASLGGTITSSVLNHAYRIASVPTANTYTFTATTAGGVEVTANGSDTGNGGASTVGTYQISGGTNTYVGATGYGVGTWSSGPWGGGGELVFTGQLRLWSQDVFGDDLIINPRGGGVYYWVESDGTSTRAIPLSSLATASDTPELALQIMVSPVDRHVIAFGVNPLGDTTTLDPLLVRWSDQEDAGNWTPTSTNTAGGQVLATGSTIVGAIRTRQEILIFTDSSIHSMRFAGAPFVYQFSVVGENLSMVSPQAAISVEGVVYFMDEGGFYVYEGAIRRLDCMVLDYVLSLFDQTQSYKVYATHNPDFSEVTWHYPVTGAADVSNYVTYNYREDVWTFGTLDRAAWIYAPTRDYPIASSANTGIDDLNYLYNHEYGHDAEGAELGSYAESGDLQIDDGNSFVFVRRVIPDFRFSGSENSADMSVIIKGRDFPLDDFVTRSTSQVLASTKQNHVRVRNRQLALRVESNGTGYGWTMGDLRFDMRTDGRK